jgi:hypothetical protein
MPAEFYAEYRRALAYRRVLKPDPQESWKSSFWKRFPHLEYQTDEELEEGPDDDAEFQAKRMALLAAKNKHGTDGSSGGHAAEAVTGVANPGGGQEQSTGSGGGDGALSHEDEEDDVQIIHEEGPAQQDDPAPQDQSGGSRMEVLEKMMMGLHNEFKSLARGVKRKLNDSDTDDEDDSLARRFTKKEKRVNVISNVLAITPGLEVNVPEVSQPKTRHFGSLTKKSEDPIYPFLPQLIDQFKILAKSNAQPARRSDPFKLMNKFFKTDEPAESVFLQQKLVPSELVSEVDDTVIYNPGASSSDIVLKRDTPAGVKESAAIKTLSHASSLMRVINSQELAIEAIVNINVSVEDILTKMLLVKNRPSAIQPLIEALQTHAKNAQEMLDDLQLSNGYMAKGVLQDYVDAIKDRRQAWLDVADLHKGLKSELAKSELDINMNLESGQLMSLFNAKAVDHLKAMTEFSKDDVVRALVKAKKPQAANAGKKKQQQKRKKWGNANKSNANLSVEAQKAGWRTSQPNTNANRGKGGNRGGRGRGKAPFSAASASTASQ